ncbi:MAG TPA: hypothetical protein VHT75_20320 [Acidimicrobiales bacterium]|jgi:hypothetical protein|nr:hypothetical protein [Acidimicrobiales bacterium]
MGHHLESAEINLADLPTVLCLADDAWRAYLAQTNRFACSHIVSGSGDGPSPILCVRHPALGLMCGRCMIDHVARDPAMEVAPCDECGAVGCVAAFALRAQPDPMAVRDTVGGVVRLVRGTVDLGLVVLCEYCRHRAAL